LDPEYFYSVDDLLLGQAGTSTKREDFNRIAPLHERLGVTHDAVVALIGRMRDHANACSLRRIHKLDGLSPAGRVHPQRCIRGAVSTSHSLPWVKQSKRRDLRRP